MPPKPAESEREKATSADADAKLPFGRVQHDRLRASISTQIDLENQLKGDISDELRETLERKNKIGMADMIQALFEYTDPMRGQANGSEVEENINALQYYRNCLVEDLNNPSQAASARLNEAKKTLERLTQTPPS